MDLEPVPRSTRRYELRPFRRRDVDPLLEAVIESLPQLQPWLPWAHTGYQRLDANRFVRESSRAWREGKAYDFAIRGHDDPDRHLGNVSVWFVSRPFRVGEIGYWVRSSAANQGVATEVTARMVAVAFDELAMHRVVLRIAVGNRPSERVAEKLGFHAEGVLREDMKVGTRWLDHTVYSLLEDEYDRRRDEITRVAAG